MLDFSPFEAHIRIHYIPLVGFKAIVGQHFPRGLKVFFDLFRLRAFAGINADQRAQIGKPQLAGLHIPFQFRTRFAGSVGQRTVDIAVADTAVEIPIVKDRRFFRIEFGHQMPVRLKRRRIRQQHAGEFVELPQRISGKLELQINPAHVHWIVDRAGKGDSRVAGAEVRLHRERGTCASQRQHAANFTGAGQWLSVVAPGGPQAENVIARAGVIPFRFGAGHFTERQRLTQRIDQDLHVGLADFIVDGDPPAIEQNVIETE